VETERHEGRNRGRRVRTNREGDKSRERTRWEQREKRA